MAGKSDTFENALLLLMFNNSNIANVGDATGIRSSTAAGSLYFSLHTADPGDAGRNRRTKSRTQVMPAWRWRARDRASL